MIQKSFSYLLKNQILFALFIIASVWFILQIRDILVLLFFSYIITSALIPFVVYLRKKGLPKIISVLIPYLLIMILIFLLIFSLVPFMTAQIQSLVLGFPRYLDQSAKIFRLKLDIAQIEGYLTGQLDALTKNAFDVTSKVFGGFLSMITVLIVSFYLLMYHDTIKKNVAKLLHPHSRETFLKTVDEINEKLGAWLRGQFILCLAIGLLSWIGLTAIGLSYSLPLALLAGILEVVPTLGPTLSAVPAVIVALTYSPTTAITVILLYIGIQLIEGHLIVPKVMQKAVGLNPIIVILAVLIGANLMGMAGALLSIPFVSFLIVVFNSVEKLQTDK